MATENKDVIRIEALKADMPSTLRNQQTGYCSDTLEIAHKFSDGTMIYYTQMNNSSGGDQIIIDSDQVLYSNVTVPLVSDVVGALDGLIDLSTPYTHAETTATTVKEALDDIFTRLAVLETP